MTSAEKEQFMASADNGSEKASKSRPDGNRVIPKDMLCGLGPCKPIAIQFCARMGIFVGAYSLCGLMTSVLSMYISSQITTIEKQYGLSSSQSGLLLSCNDIGFLLTTLLASYFARKVHIPRVLWLTVVVYGIAGIICSMAYFVSRDFVFEQAEHLSQILTARNASNNANYSVAQSVPSRQYPMCNRHHQTADVFSLPRNGSTCDVHGAETSFGVGEPNRYTHLAMAFIAVGMILQGLAKAPRYPFITTYVDDNVNKKNTAMYMGIISGVGIFGPAIAFSVGGLFSRHYVTLQDVPITPRHPAWIGAWWLGFVVFGLISIVISFPLLLFPRKLRPRPRGQKALKSDSGSTFQRAILDFLKCLFRLISNSVYMPLNASTCILLFAVAGMIAFGAKYLETQFFIPAWKANILLGMMNIVAASAGTIVGGLVVTKRKLSPVACTKMLLSVGCLSLVQVALGFVFGCGNADIVGFNTKSVDGATNGTCAESCGCDNNTYFPVCGADGSNYRSPCHAGCASYEGMSFGACTCSGGAASPGLCETTCGMLYPYLVNNVIGAFLGTLGMMPGFIVMLRSVSEGDKSMAVGFSSLMSTICGWFLGPIVFGKLIDTACVIWSASCSGKGACALYDNIDIRIKMHSYQLVPKAIAILLQVFVFIKARKKTDWSLTHDDAEAADREEGDVAEAMIDQQMDTYHPSSWKPDPIYKQVSNPSS
ncbi:solute carrier organic anion transporter family member 2A1-like isoform X1 [Dreissena polymorpha]|uniref:Solute carrier organic anion transporter family member n=1 Tax=Dreissena polymorpha TaxID=45954 RepID=A0A9D4RYK1_DREPO|nr:solute carrier organic anion transporter family member 2A1-like isoform X1 [Dreissena polymorpha]XP_052217119.1 solute carrier organic anion transporter family member 2A1-like isoform X1 [Dreissena polymorpha]KAH3883708.1 hypothetical protein DPMN_007674 [Dreissena polymorpha]